MRFKFLPAQAALCLSCECCGHYCIESRGFWSRKSIWRLPQWLWLTDIGRLAVTIAKLIPKPFSYIGPSECLNSQVWDFCNMIYHQQCPKRSFPSVVWGIFWASSMLTVFSEVCHYTRIRSPFDRHIVKYANSDPRGSSIKIPFELLDNARPPLDDFDPTALPPFSPPNKTQQMFLL